MRVRGKVARRRDSGKNLVLLLGWLFKQEVCHTPHAHEGVIVRLQKVLEIDVFHLGHGMMR